MISSFNMIREYWEIRMYSFNMIREYWEIRM